MTKFPPIPEGAPLDTRAAGEPWHVGLMVSQDRAAMVASLLFPEDVADGSDCQAEVDRPGAPCRICAARNETWTARVAAVRAAMIRAFE